MAKRMTDDHVGDSLGSFENIVGSVSTLSKSSYMSICISEDRLRTSGETHRH